MNTLRTENLDLGAMHLEYGPWTIQLTRLEQGESSKRDYCGFVLPLAPQEKRTFQELRHIIENVSLFLSWICGSVRLPTYIVGHRRSINRQPENDCGFVGTFDTPTKSNLEWLSS